MGTKRRTLIAITAVYMLLAACGTVKPLALLNINITYPALNTWDEVKVLSPNDSVPENAVSLGSVSIIDPGGVSPRLGTYSYVLDMAKAEARLAGGNLIRITRHLNPNILSNSHQILAEVYHAEMSSIPSEAAQGDSTAGHQDYAIVYLYREAQGSLAFFDVFLGDWRVYRCIDNSKAEVKVYEPGDYEITTKFKSYGKRKLNIELGKEYYVRCKASPGFLMAKPFFEQVSPQYGEQEYANIP